MDDARCPSRRTKLENSRALLSTVARFLEVREIPYFVDSGSLLGIVRSGDLIAYDTDVDIGVLDVDVPRLLSDADALRERGIAVRLHTYRSRPYSVSLRWRWRRGLSLHAHVYTDSQGFFWAPQIVKHLEWPGVIAAILAARRQAKRAATAGDGGAPRLADWSGRVVSRVRIPGFPIYTLAEIAMRGLGRVDRHHRAISLPGRLLYSRFTWVVPGGFLEARDAIWWRGCRLAVPREPERYLAHRYGDDWRTAKPRWIYFLDDRAIFSEGPETLIPRLARDPSAGAVRPRAERRPVAQGG